VDRGLLVAYSLQKERSFSGFWNVMIARKIDSVKGEGRSIAGHPFDYRKEEKMRRFTGTRNVFGLVGVVVFSCLLGLSGHAQAQELKIAVITGLTGANAPWGKEVQTTAKLVEEEITAAGGFNVAGNKVKVTFKYYDSESSPEVAGAVTERAISDGCKFVLTGPQSAAAFTSSEVGERAKVLSVDPYNTTVKLTDRGLKYYFRLCTHDAMVIPRSLEYIAYQEKRTGIKIKNVVVFTIDNILGRSKGDVYSDLAPKMFPHWNVTEYIKYSTKTQDFTIFLNKFKANKIDLILGTQPPMDAILITRQARQIDWNPIALHSAHGGWYDPDYGKTLQWQAIGVTDTCYFSPFTKIPGLNAFNEKYKKRYGYDIPQGGANFACAITLIKDCVQRAGSIEVEEMRKAMVSADLRRLEYKEGEWWWIEHYGVKFDDKGQNIKADALTNLWTTPTRFEPVFPAEFATTVAPWPKLAWTELEKQYASKYPVGK